MLEAAADAAAPEAPAEELPWALRNRAYNTWGGSTGGLFIDDPGIGAQGAVRLQLGLDAYSGDDFLFDGDSVEQNRQALSVSWTALGYLEFFAALHNRGTVSTVPNAESLHSMGDTALGVKVGGQLTDVLRLGGSLRLVMLNDVGTQEALLDATGIGLRASLAADLQGLDKPVPLIIRTNFDYYFDNSATVLEDIEDARYEAIDNPLDKDDEVRHLITRRERLGLGINRVDLFTLGIGLELPLELSEDFYLHPIADWRLGMPANRQDFNCPFFSSDEARGTPELGADDTCLDDAGFESWPMQLGVGLRVVPPVRGLGVILGADFGLGGTDVFVRELAPTAPFRLILALGYDYDAQPPPPQVPVLPPEPEGPPPSPTGRVTGTVTDASSAAPIAGAIVRLQGSELSALATDINGGFTSYELQIGPALFELSHPDYQAGSCAAQIGPTGGDVAVACTMAALPTTGSLLGRLQDQYGASVAGATVTLTGPTTVTVSSDVAGEFRHDGLAPGEYQVRVDSPLHLLRVTKATVDTRRQSTVSVALLSKPTKGTVRRTGSQITGRALRFDGATADLTREGNLAVAELADLLLRSPDIRRVRIQGNGGEQLALTRALTIKQRLVDAGVSDARLEAVGEPSGRVKLTILNE